MNRLADETSPYLRQHRDNPVDWFPWGAEAFAEAKDRNVPVLLSVGYSSCHWCHVMAHECFEDADVATKMNELFVNVKVDREERPDVDQLYMDAVQAMTGRGGWPMTVFMTPDGEPFYGGTYFPKEQFLQLLTSITEVYTERPDDVRKNIGQLMTAVNRTAELSAGTEIPDVEQLNNAVQGLGKAFDPEWGGFGKAPKFPSTFNLELMLRAYMSNGADAAKNIIVTTLDAMCSGGMYDHIGGGFARYSTDREWLTPHFEKMLPDQALLVRTYLHAFIVLGQPQWRQVLIETIGYVLTTLQHPDGGWYSAEDADSPDADGKGVEGLFHTWTPDEARAAMHDIKKEIVEATLDWYDITDEGNYEIVDHGAKANDTGKAGGKGKKAPHLSAARSPTVCRLAVCSSGHASSTTAHFGWRKLATSARGRASTTRSSPNGTLYSSPRSPRPHRCSTIRPGSKRRKRTASSCSASFVGQTAAGTAPGMPTVNRRLATTRSQPTTPTSSTPSQGSPKPAVRRAGSKQPSRPPTRCSTGSGIRWKAESSRPPKMQKH